MDLWINSWINGQMYRWITDKEMDGWNKSCINGCINLYQYYEFILRVKRIIK